MIKNTYKKIQIQIRSPDSRVVVDMLGFMPITACSFTDTDKVSSQCFISLSVRLSIIPKAVQVVSAGHTISGTPNLPMCSRTGRRLTLCLLPWR